MAGAQPVAPCRDADDEPCPAPGAHENRAALDQDIPEQVAECAGPVGGAILLPEKAQPGFLPAVASEEPPVRHAAAQMACERRLADTGNTAEFDIERSRIMERSRFRDRAGLQLEVRHSGLQPEAGAQP